MTDRRQLVVAAAYAATAAYGGLVSLRHHVPDEALGIHWPDNVPLTLAVGMGSGTSAPWPMPLATLVAASKADAEAEWPDRVFKWIGWGTVLGTLAEPATWGTHGKAWDLRAASWLHVLCGLAMIRASHQPETDRCVPLSF